MPQKEWWQQIHTKLEGYFHDAGSPIYEPKIHDFNARKFLSMTIHKSKNYKKRKEKKSKLLAQSHWSCYMIYWAKRASLFQPRPSDFAYLPVPKRMIIGVWPAYGE